MHVMGLIADMGIVLHFPYSQVEGRANCMVAAGEFIFIGFSMGLSVFSIPTCEKPTCEKVCAWEAANVEICAIKVSNFGSSSYLIGSVDELGKYI